MKIISSIKRFFTQTKPLQKATSELAQTSQKAEKACEEVATTVTNEITQKTSQTVQHSIYSTKPRPVTEADKVVAQQYFYALKNKTHITQEEMKELFAKDYHEFISGAHDLVLKHSGISSKLHPAIAWKNDETAFGLFYHPIRNVVYMDISLINTDKTKLFNLINHELKHWKQYLDILRTENLGSQTIKIQITKYKEDLRNNFLKLFEQLAKGKTEDMSDALIKNLKDHQRIYESDRKAFEQQLDNECQMLLEHLSKLQKTAIEEIGLIKENSALAKKSKMYFEDVKSAMLDNPQNLDFGLYRTRLMEKEAYLTGDMAESEASGECLFSKLKKQYTANKADKELSEQLRKGNEENQRRYAKALEKA